MTNPGGEQLCNFRRWQPKRIVQENEFEETSLSCSGSRQYLLKAYRWSHKMACYTLHTLLAKILISRGFGVFVLENCSSYGKLETLLGRGKRKSEVRSAHFGRAVFVVFHIISNCTPYSFTRVITFYTYLSFFTPSANIPNLAFPPFQISCATPVWYIDSLKIGLGFN